MTPRFERAYDAAAVRQTLCKEIKRSGKSRTEIAHEMSKALNVRITERMITAFTAESKELHRWPAEFDIAFCEAVRSYGLLQERAKRACLRLIGPDEEKLIQLGRAWLSKQRAEKLLKGAEL